MALNLKSTWQYWRINWTGIYWHLYFNIWQSIAFPVPLVKGCFSSFCGSHFIYYNFIYYNFCILLQVMTELAFALYNYTMWRVLVNSAFYSFIVILFPLPFLFLKVILAQKKKREAAESQRLFINIYLLLCLGLSTPLFSGNKIITKRSSLSWWQNSDDVISIKEI